MFEAHYGSARKALVKLIVKGIIPAIAATTTRDEVNIVRMKFIPLQERIKFCGGFGIVFSCKETDIFYTDRAGRLFLSGNEK